MLLPTAYLGNTQYYIKLLSGKAVIDLHENYVKQSYRTRCDILAANGPVSLVVPVHQPSGQKIQTCDMRIDNSKRWQHRHFQTIISAYRSSPYFSYYEDEFAPFYDKPYTFLIDFNNELQNKIFHLLQLAPTISYSHQYLAPTNDVDDLRSCFSSKPRLIRPDPHFHPEPYYQVFAERYPFMPNLSILDLLCCEGPNTLSILQASTR